MEEITVRAYTEADLPAMTAIWNEVVEEGIAFPQEESLSLDEARAFFASQSRSAVAVRQSDGKILGLYILHPNNVGRCGHICNASYAVSSESRGLRIGEKGDVEVFVGIFGTIYTDKYLRGKASEDRWQPLKGSNILFYQTILSIAKNIDEYLPA